ncbi:hypothetical protein GCM10010965_01200 [Caldalkalibacillus thermarum]|uniref:hypothetical protein n=1 Tax=Caldalkalibacillus thermarum TaxID=296745 RepID=UPI001667864F|nr:hypothetical protein [Caldalkalibacillus thermarum]GGK12000.1 hypothetical protein GCM10010965_01200 [Caldalkalibacillus thermarum]
MSEVVQDLKGLKGPFLLAIVSYYLGYVTLIVTSRYPRDLFFLNETFMLPVVIMATVMFYQRELSGYFSEIYATFPVSMPRMILRKMWQLMVFITVFHLAWTWVYLGAFGKMETLVYSYRDQPPYVGEISWLQLFSQSVPAYLLLAMLTLFGMVLTKKIYGGLGAGFSLWILEGLSRGEILKYLTLYTIYIPENTAFGVNRLLLVAISVVLLTLSMYWTSQRHKWIITDELN